MQYTPGHRKKVSLDWYADPDVYDEHQFDGGNQTRLEKVIAVQDVDLRCSRCKTFQGHRSNVPRPETTRNSNQDKTPMPNGLTPW